MSKKMEYFDNLTSIKIKRSIQYGLLVSFLEVAAIIILIFMKIEVTTSLFIGSILIWAGLFMLFTGYTASFLPRNRSLTFSHPFAGGIVYLLSEKLPKDRFVFWEGPFIRLLGLVMIAIGLLLAR